MVGCVLCRRLTFNIKQKYLQPRRSGYIVLLPEISPNLHEQSSLLKNDLPDFASFTTEKCVTTLGKHLLNSERGVQALEEKLLKDGCSDVIKEILEPLEKLGGPLDTSWGVLKTLYLADQKLMPSFNYISVHERARRARSSKFYSVAIYNCFKECDTSKMTEEEQRIVKKFKVEGHLNGLDITSVDTKEVLNVTRAKLANEKSSFRSRVEISSKLFKHKITDLSLTRDFPEQLLKLMAENREEPSRGPWTVTLHPQVKTQFLEYCPERQLRWNVWQAATRLASQHGDKSELNNSVCLETIRRLRDDEAKLLGYPTYAHLSMETKMAGSLESVENMLSFLLKKAKPIQDREMVMLQQFSWERGFEGVLQMWDIPYWQRKHKRSVHSYDQESLRDFFPIEKVLEGLLLLCEHLFSLKFMENKEVDRWHPDVRFFHIFEDDGKNPVAGFYFDPYSRSGKPVAVDSVGWVVGITPVARVQHTLPLASLIFNLPPPIYGKPSLLNFTEVTVLFQKIGHMLQQLLCKVNYAEVSGLSNIEWDAVDVCSNFMVHWLYDQKVLDTISQHYTTGEPLHKLQLAELQKHMAGFGLCQELYNAKLDILLYSTKDFWFDIMKKAWHEHFTVPMDERDSTPCSFTSIVSDQWAAAYYSHIWSKILAADVYSAFTESGVDIKNVGTRFRDTFLTFGGSCHPSEVFRRFRGRDPSTKAFLNNLGLN